MFKSSTKRWRKNQLQRTSKNAWWALIILPFKDKKSADIVRRQLTGLGSLIGKALRPVLICRKIRDEVKVKEVKAPLVNNQYVVYKFKCDLCDADYVGYTCRHIHQRIDEHKGSVVGIHMREHHGESTSLIENCFSILRKCRGSTSAFSTRCFTLGNWSHLWTLSQTQ